MLLLIVKVITTDLVLCLLRKWRWEKGERTEKQQTQVCEAQCIEKDSAPDKTGANLSYLL